MNMSVYILASCLTVEFMLYVTKYKLGEIVRCTVENDVSVFIG